MRNNLVTPKRNALAPVTSLYLDAARFVAASVVFIGHVSMIRISGGVMPDLMAYAEGAVVIFFVISGFVIAYISDTKEFTLKAYATARAVRVYSVAIPAIILTALVDQGTRAVNPGYYDAFRDLFDYAHPLLRALVAITFVNEFWTASIRIFSNGPYWSLSYEVWYYVLLGTFLFSKRSRKIWLPGLILIAVGPRILLLLPIWLMGVGSYHLSKIIRFRSHTLAIPAGLLLLAIPYLHQPDILDRFKALDVATLGSYSSLGYSRYFLWKYLIGGLFSLSVILVACSGVAIKETRTARSIRWLSGMTFSLYLYHFPLVQFFAAAIPTRHLVLRTLAIIVLTALTCTVLSLFTERKKELWRPAIEGLYRATEACMRAIVGARPKAAANKGGMTVEGARKQEPGTCEQ